MRAYALLLASILLPPGLVAQAPQEGSPPDAPPSARPTFGVVAGPVQARQLARRGEGSDSKAGFLVGAWTHVPTPVSWLGIVAEASAARLGGEYAQGPGRPTASVDVDYVSLTVLPSAEVRLGPVALRGFVGPAMDVHLRSRTTRDLEAGFQEPATQVLSGLAGLGFRVRVGRASLHLEARVREQLTDAFREMSGGIRHRSQELVFRMGMRPRR